MSLKGVNAAYLTIFNEDIPLITDPRHVSVCSGAEFQRESASDEFEHVELEMFSQCLIEESLPLCAPSLELNGKQPPKAQAKALILRRRKGHQAGP